MACNIQRKEFEVICSLCEESHCKHMFVENMGNCVVHRPETWVKRLSDGILFKSATLEIEGPVETITYGERVN